MTISDGNSTKTLALYSPAQPQYDQQQAVWPILGEESEEVDSINHLMMINRGPFMQLHDEDSILNKILINELIQEQQLEELVPNIVGLNFPTAIDILHTLLSQEVSSSHFSDINQIDLSIKIEVDLNRCLNINKDLSDTQSGILVDLLKCHKNAFAWDYKDMNGIDPIVCTHRIYVKEECCPLRQLQRRINPALKEIVKEELQKMLKAGFI